MNKVRKALIGSAALATFGLGALGGTAFALQSFSDVPESHPFHEDIEWMNATGISEGYEDGTFRPGAAVTRQAMSAFMHRANTQEIITSGALFTAVDSATLEASCPEGTQVISGGGSANGVNLLMTDSYPHPDGSGWTAQFETDDGADANFSAFAYAICGPVDNVD
jgi:hypothetical protein